MPMTSSEPGSAPGSLAEGGTGPDRLPDEERELLRAIARESIRQGLDTGEPLDPALEGRSGLVTAPGAVFVTLKLRGSLRGCIGNFEPRRPLIVDVAQNAFSAAFMDFRFPPVSEAEWEELEIHISVLTPLVPLEIGSREELLRTIRPGVDGLLLEDPPHRATFLPQVWEALPSPDQFLKELLGKAGLSVNHWSPTLRFHRYGVEEF